MQICSAPAQKQFFCTQIYCCVCKCPVLQFESFSSHSGCFCVFTKLLLRSSSKMKMLHNGWYSKLLRSNTLAIAYISCFSIIRPVWAIFGPTGANGFRPQAARTKTICVSTIWADCRKNPPITCRLGLNSSSHFTSKWKVNDLQQNNKTECNGKEVPICGVWSLLCGMYSQYSNKAYPS